MGRLKRCWRAIQGGKIVKAVWNSLIKTLKGACYTMFFCLGFWLIVDIILWIFNLPFKSPAFEQRNDFLIWRQFTPLFYMFIFTWFWQSFKEISQIPRYRFLSNKDMEPVMYFIIFSVVFTPLFLGLVDPLSWSSMRFIESEIKLENLSSPRQIAWNGNNLAIAGWNGRESYPQKYRKVVLWDVKNQKVRQEIKLVKLSSKCPLQFSNNGKLLVACSDIWETSEKQKKFKPDWENTEGWSLARHDRKVQWTGSAFSQDNQLLALAKEGEVAVWRMITGEQLLHLQDLDWVGAIAFSLDNQSLLLTTGLQHTRHENYLSLEKWNLTTGQLSKRLAIELVPSSNYIIPKSKEREKPATVFSLDRERLATNDCGGLMGGVQVWSTKTGLEIATLSKNCFFSPFRSVNQFSPDGKLLAVIYDETLAVWDVETQRVIRTLVFPKIDEPKRIAFSPDGRFLASVHNKSVKIWRVTD